MPGPPMQGQPVASSSSAPPAFSFKNSTLDEVLEDLSSRFILNLPEEELVSVERICFQVEQAHWYYEDFIRDEEPSFPSMVLKTFSRHLFHACPLLQHLSRDHDQAFQDFLDYKTSVPVCGVIMLNPSWTKCVLVKGWKSSSSWSFPRGKINAEEPEHECAAREALEETGFDVSEQIIMDAVIRLTIKEQETTFFVVPNIPEDTIFIPRTRKEISKVDWFSLTDLPAWKKGVVKEMPHHKFYGIAPIMGPLRTIIKNLKRVEWERNNADRALQTNGDQAPAAVAASPGLLNDPAIMSIQGTPGADHLSRLLGGLDLFGSSTSSSQPSVTAPIILSRTTAALDGLLPTPQATPSAAAAKKHELPPHLTTTATRPDDTPARSAFTSPTPPHSGDPTKQHATTQLSQPAATKSKFEFISPFDALASPPKKRTAPTKADVQDMSSPEVAKSIASSSAVTSSTDEDSFASAVPVSTKASRPRAPSAADHFAPASVARARYARSRGLSQSSMSVASPMSVSSMPQSVGSPPERVIPAAPRDPSKHAKHTALLQSLASDLFTKSSTPAPPSATFFPDHVRSGTVPPPVAPLPNGASMQMHPNGGPPPPMMHMHMNGLGHGAPFPPPPSMGMMNGMSAYPPAAPPSHSIPQIQMHTNSNNHVLSSSRSATPRGMSYARRDGGGSGSPIPVIPPVQPLQRNQLLSLLNGPSSSPAPQSTPFAPHMNMQPPQLARKGSYTQPTPRPVGIAGPHSNFQTAPLFPPNTMKSSTPAPAAAAQGNINLLSILNHPHQQASYR